MTKSFFARCFDRLARRAPLQSPLFRRKRGDCFDILEIALLKAAYESAELYQAHLLSTPAFESNLDLMSASVLQACRSGLFLEFGVATGATVTHLAGLVDTPIYGFDSFEGLPEDWRTGFGQGSFSGCIPSVPSNVKLVRGWFSETLPIFLSQHKEKVSFIHIDCDLYSSTKCVFDLLRDRICKGTVIQFDEYWNYPGWKKHEYLAFEELKVSRSLSCKPIGFVPSDCQVAFIVE